MFCGCYTGILLLLLGSSSGSLSGLFGGPSSLSESPLGLGKNILSFFGFYGYGSIVWGSGYTFSSNISYSGISLSSSSKS